MRTTMIIIAVIGLATGLILESEKAFYENPMLTSPTGSAAEVLAWEASEQAESLERLVETPAHSVHEATVVVELGALLLIAVALSGYAAPRKRRGRKIRSDRIT
ncbi:hypothetical protein [Nitrosospira sp. Is2]|uniref:hypothetical protein n=1 Tax=Nitrosospira sp. Is2 TaxID=3080532 RepID=UPI0029553E8C|nr:hypothetical protein [Nitrosospira sp. Is2]WON74282.1 hypothetical protein R5L00_01975 [Nitrosospira sp. Is2]